MRIHAKGLHWAVGKLADGTTKTYWYAWRGGPRLEGEPGSPEFIASYNAAAATKTPAPEGQLLALTQAYQRSQDFLDLRERTRADYVKQIAKIEQRLGYCPQKALADPRTRGVFLDWRDGMALKSKRQADYAWTVLACVVALALWRGQRQGDLLRLPWSAYDGTHMRLRQSKTGARVEIRVGGPLKAMLDATPRKSPIMTHTSEGRPWTPDGFRASWGKACIKAGISGLTFNDLRGTAVTRLALVGCTEAQIASITGHSLRDVHSILDAHYLHRDPALAESAITKLEIGYGLRNANGNVRGDR